LRKSDRNLQIKIIKTKFIS